VRQKHQKADIVASVNDNHASILGLAALLTTTASQFGEVVTAPKERQMKGRVRIVVGGAAVNKKALEYGVDAWTHNTVESLRICKGFRKTSAVILFILRPELGNPKVKNIVDIERA